MQKNFVIVTRSVKIVTLKCNLKLCYIILHILILCVNFQMLLSNCCTMCEHTVIFMPIEGEMAEYQRD